MLWRVSPGAVLTLAVCCCALPSCGVSPGEVSGAGHAGMADAGGSSGAGASLGSGGRVGSSGAAGRADGAMDGAPSNTAGSGGVVASSGGASAGGAAHGGSAGQGGASAGSGATVSNGGMGADGGRTNGGAGRSGRGGASGASGDGMGGAVAAAGASGMPSSAAGSGNTGFPPKFAGNIDTRGSIRSDFSMYWNQFSPENAGKWGSVQPNSQDSFTWTALDAMYKYANDHNIIFKQHNFIWGSQQPSWTANLTTSTGPAAVQNWMNAFCARYPNTRLIDVVNEPPPHTTPKYLNAIGGAGTSGYDWIANAFKWARQACPNAILILNDYNNVEQSSDAQHTIDIVNAIKKVGAPIDAIGCQTHGAANLSSATLKTNIDKLTSSTGLPVYITEYDLNISDDAKQASVLQDQFTMFWNEPNVKGITYWGYIVGSTWETNTGLMQSDGTMRPAMTWLMNFLGR